ncbi:MAG: acyltransferase [Arcticibacter sp.]
MLARIKQYLRKTLLFYSLPGGDKINVHKSFTIGKYRKLYISGESTVTIQQNVALREFCNIVVEKGAELRISSNVFFNNHCSINCMERIEIGEDTLIGEGVKIYDHNHRYVTEPSFEVFKDRFVSSPVSIGKNCWIGSNVTILKGVSIGDNVIVGAGCLVHRSIPANHIVKFNSQLIVEPLENGNREKKA